MKKIISTILVIAVALTMATGCAKTPDTVSQVVDMAVLNGPTGMAAVKMAEMEDKYNITAYQAPSDITAKIINGDVDVAAVPSNLAAVLYNKTEGQVVALTPIAMGMLTILGNGTEIEDVSELEGKTIVASGQGGTPEYVLQKVLENAGLSIYEDVDVKWLANHSEVSARLLAEKGTVAMLPEPFVSTVLTAGTEDNVQELFDLGLLWEEAVGEELPMGVLVARKSFVEERADDVRVLLKDLAESADFVNEMSDRAVSMVVEQGFIGKAEVAEIAIPNCGIAYYIGKDGSKEGADILRAFNKTMFEMNPASIGGAIPDEDLYYREN